LRLPKSILAKGVILLAVPLVFQLGMLAYLFKVHSDVARAEEWEAHSKEVLQRASSVRLALSEGHGAMRGASVFEEAGFESGARQKLHQLPDEVRKLREFVADDPGQQARLDKVQEDLGDYLVWVDHMEQLAQAGDWADYAEQLRTMHGKSDETAVEEHFAQFRQAEEKLGEERRVQAEQLRHEQRLVFGGAAAATIMVTLGLIVAFAKSIGNRIAVATENARRIARGAPLAGPVHGADEIAHLDAVLHDTARRLAEAAATERENARELQRRSEMLQRSNDELRYKTQENETFVYSVSHDLRSPLVNLQGFTKELSHGCRALREVLDRVELPAATRKRIDSIIEEEIVVSTGFIQTAVTRSGNIINALLKLSRAGRVEYQRLAVDLNPVVERIVASMRVSLNEKQAQVVVKRMPQVLADPIAIEQVLANLVGNAVNYLDRRRPGRIELGVAESVNGGNGLVTVYVRDNGLGIPAAYLSKLFVAFQRLHGEVAPGEGIGLALVKRIVDRHGGRVWAESTEGVGTTFYVSLRKADRAAEPAAGRPIVRGVGDKKS
jgi:signal transduction histidine kinase